MVPARSAAFSATLDRWTLPWSAGLAEAARAPDPGPALRLMLADFGFEGLSCIALAPACDDAPRAVHVWSTAASQWAALYRDRAYACVDPRVTMTSRRLSPVIWDGADIERDWPHQRFLADAARSEARSGLAVSFRDASNAVSYTHLTLPTICSV